MDSKLNKKPPYDKRMNSVGRIAEKLEVPVHVVEYAIKTNNIDHFGECGRYRLFSDDAVEQIKEIIESRKVPA